MSNRIKKNGEISLQKTNDEILEGIYINSGITVRNKIGGPSMIIMGFLQEPPKLREFSVVGDSIYSGEYRRQIYSKVFVNSNRLSAGELKIVEDGSQFCNKIASFIFYKNSFIQNSQLKVSFYGSDNLIIVCKYWDETDNKFKYELNNLSEINIPNK